MQPELRLVRYFVAVAEERNITRAAERLHISQPALSAAVRQLELGLPADLLDRSGRVLELTPAGSLMLERGRELLLFADGVFDAVRERDGAAVGRLGLGLTPTARYGLGPELLAACGERASGVMLYPREDTTGALLRELRAGRLDLAVLFCAAASAGADGVEVELLRLEPAVVHVRSDHALARRSSVALADLADETLLVADSRESGGFTARVLSFFGEHGLPAPRVEPDPYPDLGLQAVREGRGIVLYVRSAFPAAVEGSAFVPLEGDVAFPFSLAWRSGARSAALDAVLAVARSLG